MKNVLRMIALSLVLVMSVMILASCGAPNSDPDKAKAALEENGYEAVKLEKIAAAAALIATGATDVECMVTGMGKIDDKYEAVAIIYFEDADAADAAWDKIQDYAEEAKEEVDDDSGWVCDKSGAMIYFGTKNAVKAAA